MEIFHAHIYFSKNESVLAEKVRDNLIYAVPQAAHVSELILDPSGPHPRPMFVVYIPSSSIGAVARIIDRKRAGLSVLIHPAQEDKLAAHTIFARWLGERLPLNFDAL